MPLASLGEVIAPSGILRLVDPDPGPGAPAVRVDEIPPGRALRVVGERLTDGAWAGAWDWIAIEVAEGAIDRAELHGHLEVEHAHLRIVDDALAEAGPDQGWRFTTSWGGGRFPVYCDRDADDRLLRVRVQFHTQASDDSMAP